MLLHGNTLELILPRKQGTHRTPSSVRSLHVGRSQASLMPIRSDLKTVRKPEHEPETLPHKTPKF